MDLRNNAIGRNLAINPSLRNYTYDQMFEHALNNGVLITDATKAYKYFDLNKYADDMNRLKVVWNVENDVIGVYGQDGSLATYICFGGVRQNEYKYF